MVYTVLPGFYQFPTAIGSCVQSTAAAGGCSSCSSTALASSCKVTNSNGLSYSICSQVADGNKPSVTSCYVGTFSSTFNFATITTCSPAREFCKVIIFLNINYELW